MILTIGSLILISSSGFVALVLPSNVGSELVNRYVVPGDSVGLSNVEDIEESRDLIIYIATYEYVHRFSLVNNTFLSPLKLNFTSDAGLEGALDIEVLGEGWGTILFAGPYGQSAVQYLENGDIGNYTSSVHFETSNARFTRVVSSYEHDLVFLGTDDKGVGMISTYNRNVTFINDTHGLPHNQVTELKVRGNYLIIGTLGGFAVYNILSEELIARSEDDLGGRLQVIAIDYYHATQTVYVGNFDGLLIFRRTGDTFNFIGQRFNQQSPSPLPYDEVWALELDIPRNRVYIGTEGGLSFIELTDDNIVHRMVTGHGLEDVTIRSIRVGFYGRYLYLGTTLQPSPNMLHGSLFQIPVDYNLQVDFMLTQLRGFGILLILPVAPLWVYHLWTKRKRKLSDSELLSLIDGGESRKVEFKETLFYDLKEEVRSDKMSFACFKTIAAFLNTCGGVLFIGVDNNGVLKGLEPDFTMLQNESEEKIDPEDQFVQQFQDLYNKWTLDKKFETLVSDEYRTLNGIKIYVVQVEQANEPVYITKKNEFYKREKKGSNPIGARQIWAHWEIRNQLCED
jgi:hypothetical protein